jgi:methylaspartate ammonia-lyase
MKTATTMVDRILNHPSRAGRSSFDLTVEEVCDTDDDVMKFRELVATGIIQRWPVGFATHRVNCALLEK